MEIYYGIVIFLTIYIVLTFEDKFLTKKYWKYEFKDSTLFSYLYFFVVVFVYPLTITYLLLLFAFGEL